MRNQAASRNERSRRNGFVPMPCCPDCGADMIAAVASAHLGPHCIRNHWSCDACGTEFATLVDPVVPEGLPLLLADETSLAPRRRERWTGRAAAACN